MNGARRCCRSVATVACGLLVLASCGGPQPAVTEQSLALLGQGADAVFWVEAVVANRSRGDGQVEVTATVSARDTKRVLARESRLIDLRASESQTVVMAMPRPQSVAGDGLAGLALDVEARYPVQ